MKSKILAKLVVKYKGLSKHLLGLVADKLAAKVTEESEIEAAIDDLDNQLIPVSEYAKLLQQEGDRRVSDAKKAFEKADAEEETDEDQETDKPKGKTKPKGGDDPITKLTEAVQALTQKVSSYEQKEQQQTLTQKLHAALKEKKIPEVLAKGRAIEKEEDIESVVAEIEADHDALKQELTNQGLLGSTPPLAGSGASADKTKVASDIDAWAKSNAPKSDSKTI